MSKIDQLSFKNEEGNKMNILFSTNSYLIGQITYAEAKHGVLITLNSALIGFLLTNIFNSSIELGCFLETYFLIWIVLLLISVVLSILSFLPNYFSKKNGNIFFYKHLSLMKAEDYYKKIQESPKHLINQNISLSRICTKKMSFFETSVIVAYISFPIFLIIFIAKYLIDKKNSE